MMQSIINAHIDEDLKKQAINPFYSEENMIHLRKSIKDLENGKGTEHELIKVEE